MLSRKFFVLTFLATVATTGASAQSLYGDTGLYLGAVGGVQFFGGLELGNGDEVDFEPGYTVGGQVGYDFGQLRLEGELTYQAAEFEDGVGATFDTTVIRGSANLLFDITEIITEFGNLTPYAGGGVGIANIEVEGTDGNSFSDDETGLAFHGEGGIAIGIGSNLALVPNYRFEWVAGNDVAGLDGDLYGHALRLTGQVSF